MRIDDLRRRPQFFDAVAECIWRAWWQPRGYALAHITSLLRDNMDDNPFPFALVAHDADRFLGTASVIASDLDERPEYTPWVAAVWVETGHRRRGVGTALVEQAAQTAFALDIRRLYLCALPQRAPFYATRSWHPIEEGVGPHRLTVLIRDA